MERFCPSEQRLIDTYLRPKIAGEDVGGGYIHDADVTSDHPYDLVRKHAPAPDGTGNGAGRKFWFFFSPERYVSDGVGGKTSARRGGSHAQHRARAVVGADGEKKGMWHPERKKKTVAGSGGGYFTSLTYHEVTPSGSVNKPGWLMLEYGIEEEHGGGAMVLCKVYRSPRCPGSKVPSRKRKADMVEKPPRPRQRTHQKPEMGMFFAAANQETEDISVAAYQEHVLGSGDLAAAAVLGSGKSAAAAVEQCTGTINQTPQGQATMQEGTSDVLTLLREFLEKDCGEMALQLPPDFNYEEYLLHEDQPAASVPPCAAQTKMDDDNLEEISLQQFIGSSVLSKLVPVPPPCAAQTEDEDDVMEISLEEFQMSSAPVCAVPQQPSANSHADGDGVEFTPEELMGPSTPGQCITMPSLDDDEDDDDEDTCCLACPPMDDDILESLRSDGDDFDPALMEEFTCDMF